MHHAAVALDRQSDNQCMQASAVSHPLTPPAHGKPVNVTTGAAANGITLPAAETLLAWPGGTEIADSTDEAARVDWLILHFNHWFAHHNVILQRGAHEPEYFPGGMPAEMPTGTPAEIATKMPPGMEVHDQPQPARIVFAHGYFASALHEISHWCIAGPQRRLLADLGYWYAPDGRNAEQQALFEQVEVKPQALEWLFSRACQRKFRVSLDNLNGEAGSGEQFKDRVYARVQDLLAGRAPLPQDARRFIDGLCRAIRAGQPLQASEFSREQL